MNKEDNNENDCKCYYCSNEGLYFEFADYKRVSVCKRHLNMEASS